MQTFNIPNQTYVDENDLWKGILAAATFEIFSTDNRQKNHSPVQLIFGRDMNLLIKHTVNWELLRQQ